MRPATSLVSPVGLTDAVSAKLDARNLFDSAYEERQGSVIRYRYETGRSLTLGLTETWVSRADGAAFPLCPGVQGGVFDPDKHAFVNLTTEEVVSDMTAAIGHLRGFNPDARVILTVSPVPLAATAVDRHVLVSTTLSKSVLRVAADSLARTLPDVTYFRIARTRRGRACC